ncbi:DUF308 domain-containing protein [Oscillibacter sp.]|uniref:DUF308 domain-containing protein n=1 Tax=Oscillibacter sp. TaxID=1945593 RepID=UPI0026145C28|nr:DUF308 domain-containing protein [Oscillibacter sp.]
MKIAKGVYIAASAAFCALGLLLICAPDAAAAVIGGAVGAALLLFGGVKLLGYFSKDLYRLAFQYDLAFGILLSVLGILLLFHIEGTMRLLCVVLGVIVLAEGLFKVQMALDARRFGLLRWQLILVMALATGISGVVLIVWPEGSVGTVIVFMGISLLLEGALNLSVALCTIKIIQNQRPEDPL